MFYYFEFKQNIKYYYVFRHQDFKYVLKIIYLYITFTILSLMNKTNFFLTKFPLISVLIFYSFCLIAAFFYPGSEKEIINYKNDGYSLSHNFLSELGCFKTNTDEINSKIIKEDNTISMVFFNTGLILIGFTIVLFYFHFVKFFKISKESNTIKKLSLITAVIGVISGFMFSGVGFVPHDVSFIGHVIFANGAFLFLFLVSIFHTLTIYRSNKIGSVFSLGYLLFSVCLLFYVCIIFLGPKIGPGFIFNEKELVLQVVAQKTIVILFTLAMLSQVLAFRKA